MQRWWRRLLRLAATVAAVLVCGVVVPAAHSAAGPLTVTQNLLPGLTQVTDLGSAGAGTPMTLVISVARPDPAGEQALLDALHDPASPQFGRFLSPEEFSSRFGVPQSQADRVKTR